MRQIVVLAFVVCIIAIPVLGLPAVPISDPSTPDIAPASADLVAQNGVPQFQPYRPPLTLLQLWNMLLKAARDWFTDLILQLLGITATQLIRDINTCAVGMEQLVAQAIIVLGQIIDRVPVEIKEEINAIINNALANSLEIMEPLLEQLRQIIIHLPESKGNSNNNDEVIVPQDFLSELIEALLGVSLQEFLTNINNVFVELNVLLNETLQALHNVAAQVSGDIAEQIEELADNTVVEAQELLRPLLTSLDKLPIYAKYPSSGIASGIEALHRRNQQVILQA